MPLPSVMKDYGGRQPQTMASVTFSSFVIFIYKHHQMKKQLIPFVIAIALSVLFFTLGAVTCKRTEIVEVEKPYPVTVEKPVPVHDTVYNTKTVYLPKVETKHDTVTNTITTIVHQTDTVQVQVPISRQDYEIDTNDVNLKVRISGFEPSLDYVQVTNHRKLILDSPEAPRRRFSVGIELGYGFTMKTSPEPVFEPRPYLGIGLQYNLFTF